MLENLKTNIENDIAAIAAKQQERKYYIENRQTIERDKIQGWIRSLRDEFKILKDMFVVDNSNPNVFKIYDFSGKSLLLQINVNIKKTTVPDTADFFYVPKITIDFSQTDFSPSINAVFDEIDDALTIIEKFLRNIVVYARTGRII